VFESQKRGVDFKGLIREADVARSMLISIESLTQVVPNRLRVPALLQLDVVFLAKKYLIDLPQHL
jgi:hypothetical protein